MKLMEPLLNQVYHHFLTIFKFVKLLNDLLYLGTPACGTSTENRKGFPESMKNGKTMGKEKEAW